MQNFNVVLLICVHFLFNFILFLATCDVNSWTKILTPERIQGTQEVVKYTKEDGALDAAELNTFLYGSMTFSFQKPCVIIGIDI